MAICRCPPTRCTAPVTTRDFEQIFAGRDPRAQAAAAGHLVAAALLRAESRSRRRVPCRAMARRRRQRGAVKTPTARAASAPGSSALRRRAFVQIARDYNRRIARYSELATPGQLSPDSPYGILIKLQLASTATRPATPPGNRQSSAVAAPHLPGRLGAGDKISARPCPQAIIRGFSLASAAQSLRRAGAIAARLAKRIACNIARPSWPNSRRR